MRWLVAAAVGFAAAFVVVVAGVLLTGPSPADVWDGTITQAQRVRDVLVIPFGLPAQASDWAIVSVAAAAVALVIRRRGILTGGSPWPGVVRVLVGLLIWFAATATSPITFNPGVNVDTIPIVLVWVAAFAPAGFDEPVYMRLVRVFLPAFALANVLQVYPVAGSQIGAASLLWGPVGALCIADGLRVLSRWSEAREGTTARTWMTVGLAALCIAVAVKFAVGNVVRPGITNAIAYGDTPSLDLNGADRLHIAPAEADVYRQVTNFLKANCDSFVGYPSVNSFYLWSNIEPPQQLLPGAWMELLDAKRQQRVVDEVRAADRPCVVRNEQLAAKWLGGRPRPMRPLVDYVFGNWQSVAKVGNWELFVPAKSGS